MGREHDVPRTLPLTPNFVLTLPRRADNHSGPAADAHVPVTSPPPLLMVSRYKLFRSLETRGRLGSHPRFSLSCDPRSEYRAARPRPFSRGENSGWDDRGASETVDRLPLRSPTPVSRRNMIHSNPVLRTGPGQRYGVHARYMLATFSATFQRIRSTRPS